MVQLLCFITLLVIIVALYKNQIDSLANRYILAKIIKYIIFVLACLVIAFFAFFGIGEIASGDLSGVGHFYAIIPLGLLIFVLIYTPKKHINAHRQ